MEEISIGGLLKAPAYELDLGEEDHRKVLRSMNRIIRELEAIGEIVKEHVPPDYRERVASMSSETADGRSVVSVGVLPESDHGAAIRMFAAHNDKPCDCGK